MSTQLQRTTAGLAILAYMLALLLACTPPGPQPPAAVTTPVAQASPTAPVASVGVATPTTPPPTATTAPAPESPWTSYTNGNEVLALAAGEGYIWAGTGGGAVRWNTADGTYAKYTRDDGLAHNAAWAVTVNGAGTAWFRTGAAGVSRFTPTGDGQWTTYKTLEEAIEADYDAITALRSSTSLATTSGHGPWVVQPPDKVWPASGPVKVYDGQRWITHTIPYNRLEEWHRAAPAVGPDGQVWVGTGASGLSVFDGQSWTTYTYLNTGFQGPTSGYQEPTASVGFAGGHISAIAVDAAGTVWVGSEMDRMAMFGGLSRFDGREWVAYLGLLSRHQPIRSILPDGAGGAWLDTRYGLSHFDGEDWTHYAEEQGLPSRQVNALVLDSAGQVWAGTEKGLARFTRTGWQAFLTNDGLAANDVRAVTVDKAGRVWFGTTKGLSVLDGTRWRTHTQADGLADDSISALAVDSAGHIWAGTNKIVTGYVPEPAGAGVSVYDGTSWRTYTRADGLASDTVTAVAVDKTGNVWVGGEQYGPTGGKGVSVYDGTTWRTYTTEDGLAYDSASAIAVDAAGNVWIGACSAFYSGGRGVSVFTPKGTGDGQTWTTYTITDGLASNEVTAIAVDGVGNAWIGTRESGISRYNGQTWTTYTVTDGLASNEVTAIAVDKTGNVWVGGKGVSVFDGTTWRAYTTKHGLVNDYVHALAVGADGSLWIGTSGGVSHFRPGRVTP